MLKILSTMLMAVLLVLPPGSRTVLQEAEGIAPPLEPAALSTAVTFTIIQLTDNAQEDSEPVLAVDSGGKAHIAYTHNGDLHYITDASGTWITTTIAGDAAEEFKPSITVDGSDAVHLTYYAGEAPSVDLYYASNAGGSWGGELIETVSIPNVYYLGGGIAVDGAGLAYVVYATYDGEDYEIGLRYQESAQSHALAPQGGWVSSSVTDNAVYDRWPSIAVEVTGTVHVAYQSSVGPYLNEGLYHASNAGGLWTATLVAAQDFSGYEQVSIAVDGSGNAHLASQCSDTMSTPEICYFTDASGAWMTETLTFNEDHDQDPAIALDSSGKAYVAYRRYGTTYHVHYATNASGAWSGAQVSDSTTGNDVATMDRSLAIDNAGYLHIAWSGNDGGGDSEIYYARSDSPIAPPANDAPYAPNTPSPMDGASGVSAAAALRWEGGDPDAGDTVTYDVYLSIGTLPALEQSDLTTTVYTPTLLNPGWSYVWKIVARDNHGAATEGPLWTFTVAPEHKVFLPLGVRNQSD